MSMEVLLIGGTRFVGYLAVWRLLAGGHRVAVLNRGLLPDPFGGRVERLRGDRTTGDLARLLAGRRFDAVLDFAAYTGEDGRRIAALLEGRVGHHVMVSSGQVYLVRQGCPRPAREEDYDGPLVPRPASPVDAGEWDYGAGKRDCEDALTAAWAARRFPATRVRIPMVNGERDHFRRMEGYLWRLLDGSPVLLPDGGLHRVRHVYGAEVARFLCEILGRSETFDHAYNLAQEEIPTLAELVEKLRRLLGSSAAVVAVPAATLAAAGLDPQAVSPFSGSWMSFIDPARARDELGFRHEPLDGYLGKIVASFLAHPPASPPDALAARHLELSLARRGGSP
jgi:nucleoside-diphosphate-sugar epimerase